MITRSANLGMAGSCAFPHGAVVNLLTCIPTFYGSSTKPSSSIIVKSVLVALRVFGCASYLTTLPCESLQNSLVQVCQNTFAFGIGTITLENGKVTMKAPYLQGMQGSVGLFTTRRSIPGHVL